MFRPLALQPLLQHLNGIPVGRSLAESNTEHRCRATHGYGANPSLGVCHLLVHGLIALGIVSKAVRGRAEVALTAGLRSLLSNLLDDAGLLASLLHGHIYSLSINACDLGIDHPSVLYPIQVIHQSGRYRPHVIPSVT